MYHLNSIVPSGFEVNQPAEVAVVAGGYRISKDAMDSVKYVECVDEKRTINAYYHEKLRSGARVGIILN